VCALVLNCTLKPSPAESNTEALAMDAMISETDDQERPVAYNRVAGVVVTGNLVAVARALQTTPVPPPEGQ
jgi:hypothetical protein